MEQSGRGKVIYLLGQIKILLYSRLVNWFSNQRLYNLAGKVSISVNFMLLDR